jgi:hypothetical protein
LHCRLSWQDIAKGWGDDDTERSSTERRSRSQPVLLRDGSLVDIPGYRLRFLAYKKIGIWSEGVTTVKVADIVEETHEVKTFRLVGEKPVLFSYRPGQFVTFLLNIGGEDVERSYSMSSSPSRPHVLEVTVERVPGGIVSNWLCDHVKLGQRLTIKGPAGNFSCFDYPAAKMDRGHDFGGRC